MKSVSYDLVKLARLWLNPEKIAFGQDLARRSDHQRRASCRSVPSQGSVGGNALSDYRSRNLSDEIAGWIIDIQRERTAVGVALIAKN